MTCVRRVADRTPAWNNKFIAFPDRPGDFNLSSPHHPRWKRRFAAFRGSGNDVRRVVYYDEVHTLFALTS